MKRHSITILLASLAFSGASRVLAQEPATYLRIIREDIKEGKAAAHEKTEMAYAHAFSKTKAPSYTALDAIMGPSQVWFLDRFDSFEALEEARKVTTAEPLSATLGQLDEPDGALRTMSRTMMLRYMKDLSYTPVPGNLAKYRYVRAVTVRIRLGHQAEFAEMRKILNDSWEKSGSKQRRTVYTVAYGAPAGTYIILAGMESLKALDGPPAEALGARYTKLYQDIVVSSEAMLFAVSPKMSNPPKEYITADPDFWAPKPKPAAK